MEDLSCAFEAAGYTNITIALKDNHLTNRLQELTNQILSLELDVKVCFFHFRVYGDDSGSAEVMTCGTDFHDVVSVLLSCYERGRRNS
jgi:hypothetical protein